MSDSLLQVILFLAILSSVLHGQKLADDAAALLQVKKLFNSGAALRTWDSNSSSPCSWLGITCSVSDDDLQRRVVSLNLTGVFVDNCSGSRHASWEDVETQRSQAAFMADPSCYQMGDDSLCKLHGTLAPEVGNLTELQALVLPFNSLTGEIPKEVGKLRKLQVLELQQNGFTGGIPQELGNLSSLQVLNLEGNSLEGLVPLELGRCGSLVRVRLGGNKLRGGIPVSFGGLARLVHLSVPSNELNYPIPVQLQGTCGALEYLDLGNNYFIREIPAWLGNCSRLEFLVLKSNYFVGVVPWNIGQLKMLKVLDVSMNRLSGQVPASLGSCLELRFLVLTNPVSSGPLAATGSCVPEYRWGKAMKQEFNVFTGALPGSITSLPELQIFWAPQAAFSGELPDGFGACRSLMSLNLARNNFTGVFPPGLSRCSSLRYLDLSSNRLKGKLPEKLPASCLSVFNVSRNELSGVIPAWGNLSCGGVRDRDSIAEDDVNPSRPFLIAGSSRCRADDDSCRSSGSAAAVSHDLSMNKFAGPVPAPFFSQEEEEPGVFTFLLAGNQLSGRIPSSFFSRCGSVKAFVVDLSGNQIEGELCEDFGACKSLVEFNASRNQIGSGLPRNLAGMRNLTLLDLSHNRLGDVVPGELGELRMLKYLVLANNSLTGEIPEQLGRASSLSLLDLSSNRLSGGIPSGFGNLSHLESLILNNNLISGIIPETLIGISSLVAVNLAYNNLSGAIPENGSWVALCDDKNFQGNPYLKPCTASFAAPATSSAMQETSPPVASPLENTQSGGGLSIVVIVAITSGCAVGVVLFVLALLVQCTKQRVPTPPSHQAPGSGGRKEVVTFTSINFRFTYENVVRATGNFSVDYLIGNGGFGATYKAEMMPGLVIAVKRLAIGRFQGVQGVQQFDAEIRTLGRIRHPNLVTLIGYHASEAEMFLIYNYFPRGNLDNFIHNRSRGEITWVVVHRIALGIADALAYLHDECVPRVLHRDIKPSNILLDNNLTAYLSDFGLARLLGTSETHATTDVAGTFGYVAPEYAMTCRVSEKADVYSYGVVLLELLSGKKALDAAFSDYGHGFNIVGWACLLIGQGRAHEVFIVELWEMGPENYLLESLKLAVMCTVDSLTVRPTMRQVVDRLRHIASSTPFP